jgi:ABC-type Fe3+ transport system substrate-binding protein
MDTSHPAPFQGWRILLELWEDIVTDHNKPVTVVSPCEGSGYKIGLLSPIAGAKHMDEAKKFYGWALTPESQRSRRLGTTKGASPD